MRLPWGNSFQSRQSTATSSIGIYRTISVAHLTENNGTIPPSFEQLPEFRQPSPLESVQRTGL